MFGEDNSIFISTFLEITNSNSAAFEPLNAAPTRQQLEELKKLSGPADVFSMSSSLSKDPMEPWNRNPILHSSKRSVPNTSVTCR